MMFDANDYSSYLSAKYNWYDVNINEYIKYAKANFPAGMSREYFMTTLPWHDINWNDLPSYLQQKLLDNVRIY